MLNLLKSSWKSCEDNIACLPFVRSPLWGGLSLFIFSICLGAITNRFSVGFSAMSFGQIGEAAALALTGNLAELTAIEPPGYPLLLAPFIALGIKPVFVALAVNNICGGLTVLFSFLIGRQFFKPVTALAVGVMVACHFMLLAHAQFLWMEAPFLTATLAATWYAIRLVQQDNVMSLKQAALLGVLVALPFVFRYMGAVFAATLISFVCFELSNRKPISKFFQAACVLCVTAAFIAALVFARNFIMTGNILGHPMGVAPAYQFFDALVEMVYNLGIFGLMPLPAKVMALGQWCKALIFAGLILFLLLLVVLGLRDKATRIIPLNITAYVVFFSVAEAITRLDLIHFRFVMPLMPFVVIGLFLVLTRIGTHLFSQEARFFGFFLKAVLSLGVIFAIVTGIKTAMKGVIPSDFAYSPKTLGVLEKEIAPGEMVIVNRMGAQLRMHRPDTKAYMMPFGDPWNGDYTKAYGVKFWTRSDFEKFIKEHNVKRVVFFMGKEKKDPFLEKEQYGTFMGELFSGHTPHLAKKEDLEDGVIITLK